MIRTLLRGLLAVLVGWPAVAPSAAVAEPSVPLSVHAYDHHHAPADFADTASRRGPPAAYRQTATAYEAGDRWLRCASARLGTGVVCAYHAYDQPAQFVHVDGADATTAARARLESSSAALAGVAAKAVPEIAEGSGRLFVTSGRGVTYDIPKGWSQRMADNGKGLAFQRGGATGNPDMIRIMEPTAKYPIGYVRVYKSDGQPVDIFGKPGPGSATHISQDDMGQWPGWPQ